MPNAANPKFFVLMNHPVDEALEALVKDSFGPLEVHSLAGELGDLWSGVATGPELDPGQCHKVLQVLWQRTAPGDYLLVMGEWGMTFAVVDWCLHNGRKPLHTTTVRQVTEHHTSDQGIHSIRRNIQLRHFRFYSRF